MCFVWISEQTAIISQYSFNWLVFITETQCVYCAVRTGYLYIIQVNVSAYCVPHIACKPMFSPTQVHHLARVPLSARPCRTERCCSSNFPVLEQWHCPPAIALFARTKPSPSMLFCEICCYFKSVGVVQWRHALWFPLYSCVAAGQVPIPLSQ